MALFGGLLLSMALASAWLQRLPVSTSVIYFGVGVAVGPIGLGWLHIDAVALAPAVERVAEVAVILSLFVGGLKLRLPVRDPAWRVAALLAGPVMILTIGGVAALGHLVLGLPVWAAILLGAVLAPTDPVLASAVAVNDAADEDRLRVGLTGEAGLNDGTAFPFVVLALAWAEHAGAGGWLAGWAAHRLLWAVPAGLGLGFALGLGIGRVAIALRSRYRDTNAPSDLFALAVVFLAYVAAEAVGAWGFLATFAAGVGVRRAELQVVRRDPHPDVERGSHPPSEHLVAPVVEPEALDHPAVAAGVLVGETLSFGDTAERILEVLLVIAVGVSLAEHWDPRGVPLALALFVVIRPAAARLVLMRSRTTGAQRSLLGWFGIRGIGSLYYVGYALRHGATGDAAREVVDLTLTVVAVSVVLHGVTAQPVLGRYERSLTAGHPAPA